MTCAISQPTFLPWLGWFDLADQANVMIILDDVQFDKRSWQQRNRIRTYNGLEYVSVPVKTSGRYQQRIIDCEFADQPFIEKILKTLRTNYARAPYFASAIDELATMMETAAGTGRLVELNCALISWMAARLEVVTPMIRASTMGIEGRRGEHLAAICEGVKANHYLSSAGAEDYLVADRKSFDRRGISVSIHAFEHPQYVQRFTPFIPYASALDLIFNVGPAAPAVLRSGRRSARALGDKLPSNSEEF